MASALYAADPAARLAAACACTRAASARSSMRAAADWPPDSPGALNAWLLLVTTKAPRGATRTSSGATPRPPSARRTRASSTPTRSASGPRSGTGRRRSSAWPITEALSVTTLLHGDGTWMGARARCARVVLFLDEPAWNAAGISGETALTPHADPRSRSAPARSTRAGGARPVTAIVGKAPQHPAAHKLYRRSDIDGFLRSIPA